MISIIPMHADPCHQLSGQTIKSGAYLCSYLYISFLMARGLGFIVVGVLGVRSQVHVPMIDISLVQVYACTDEGQIVRYT